MGRVQTARYDGLLRRLFSIKGEGSLLAETLGDAFPVIQLEGGPIELLRLSDFILGIGGLLSSSAVGATNAVQLFNPAGSGKLVMPTKMLLTQSTTNALFMGVTDVALATASVGRQRDTREGVGARAVAQIRTGDDAVVPVGAGRFRMTANVPEEYTDPDGLAVLAPGTAFTIVTLGLNVAMNVTFFWRERIAEPSELLF